MADSINRTGGGKPAKPYPEFPLFPHATGRWAKKIRGQTHYFGPWDDPDGALDKYLREKDDLHAGRKPRTRPDAYTMRDLSNEYLNAQRRKLDAGELRPRTFNEYHAACVRVVEAFGANRPVDDLAADDFEVLRADLAASHSLTRLGVAIQQVRQVFKWAWDNDKIDRPVRYGQAFNKPSARLLRAERNRGPVRTFTAAEVRDLLHRATLPMRAMILLGINCGMGNTDLAEMPTTAIKLDAGTLDYPRPKTGVQRRATLWPETVEALRAVLAERPTPKHDDDAHRVFLTTRGTTWLRYEAKTDGQGVRRDNIGREFQKAKKAAGVNGERRGFYVLRHTFETIAGETGDQKAVDFIMGHAPHAGDMSAVYREWTGDKRERERLRRVTDHVRAWLWPVLSTVEWRR